MCVSAHEFVRKHTIVFKLRKLRGIEPTFFKIKYHNESWE